MKSLKLNWGHPDFLSPYYEHFKYKAVPQPLGYQKEPLPELVDQIKRLHEVYQNCNIEGKHLVIGNGATQLLSAAMYATSRHTRITAQAPYFTRFPTQAYLVDNTWIEHENKRRGDWEIVTSPNNPDGKFYDIPNTDVILDACYNWFQYTPIGHDYSDAPIVIFSASKALGLASSRVGWAFVKDENLANEMKSYIEISSSGVSLDSQHKVAEAIKYSMDTSQSVFFYGRMVLEKRWKEIGRIKDKVPFEILSENGMFLYCRFKNKNSSRFLEERVIEYTHGTDMGMDEEYFRLSIGCSDAEFNDLIWRLSNGI